MSKDYMVLHTKESQEEVGKICDEVVASMSPENTLTDVLTEIAIKIGDKVVGRDMMDKTIAELNTEECEKELLSRLWNSNLRYREFEEVTKPEELM